MSTLHKGELDRIAEKIKKGPELWMKKFEATKSMWGTQPRANVGKDLAETLTSAGVDITSIMGKAITLEPSPGSSSYRSGPLGGPTADPTIARRAYERANMAKFEAFKNLISPDLIQVQVMDKPFLIWESHPIDTPALPFDSLIQSKDSFIRVGVSVPPSSYSYEAVNVWFTFYYIWQNPTPAPVWTDFATSFVFNGECSIQAAPGFLSGTSADLYIYPSLLVLRWKGWGSDPQTGDQTAVVGPGATGGGVAMHLHAQGGHAFQGPGIASQSLSFMPMDIGYRGLIVPGNAWVLLGAIVFMTWGFDDDSLNVEDGISVDFSNNGRFIANPSMIVLAATP